jgi:uncharacterized protein YndB with AHSA1/START domain
MEAIELSFVINRPVEEVFAYLANLENDAEWRREWVEANKTSQAPLGVGATFRLDGEMLGRRIPTVYEVIEYEPNRTAAWKAVSGPLPLTFRRIFEGVEGGTQVTNRYEAELRGFLKLVKPLLMNMGKHQLEGDIPRLKELLEAPAL